MKHYDAGDDDDWHRIIHMLMLMWWKRYNWLHKVSSFVNERHTTIPPTRGLHSFRVQGVKLIRRPGKRYKKLCGKKKAKGRNNPLTLGENASPQEILR